MFGGGSVGVCFVAAALKLAPLVLDRMAPEAALCAGCTLPEHRKRVENELFKIVEGQARLEGKVDRLGEDVSAVKADLASFKKQVSDDRKEDAPALQTASLLRKIAVAVATGWLGLMLAAAWRYFSGSWRPH